MASFPLRTSGHSLFTWHRLAYWLIFLRRERIKFPQFSSETTALRRLRIALLLRRTTGLSEIVRSLVVRPLIIRRLAVGSAQLPTLDHHLTANIVRGEQPLNNAAVTRRLLRRNLKRYGGELPAWAHTDRKSGGPLRQRAEPPALQVEYLYPLSGPHAHRHLDKA